MTNELWAHGTLDSLVYSVYFEIPSLQRVIIIVK
jgi:hypothetical protein